MKLISLNVGIKIDNTQEVTDFLKQENVDIVGLQESVRHFDETVFKPFHIAKDTKDALNLKSNFFAPIYYTDAITKGNVKFFDFGGFVEQGTQLLANYNIVNASNDFYFNEYRYGFEASEFKAKDWCRSFLTADLDIDGKTVRFINVHGIWNATRMGDERTINQSNAIIKKALKDDVPVVIMGDFNLLPGSESIALLNKHFRNLCKENNIKTTRPEFDDGLDKGNMVVDYIFVNDKIQVNNFEVIKTDISDHYPLLLDFEVK